MKRNALIKGQILKMRGQKEDRRQRMLKGGEPLGEMRGGGGVSVGSSGRS